jgi:hypothetical protein
MKPMRNSGRVLRFPAPQPSQVTPPRLMPPMPLLFAIVFTIVFLLHAPLLRLPYFWDEAGHYIPAARDLLLSGDPIPKSTISNAHPPLVMAWLALWWKLSGYTPAVTRTAMLLVSAFALLGVFRLARQLAGTQVAVATAVCTALYPVFFAQSTMAHLDIAAAGFTIWGLRSYLKDRALGTVGFFALAGLAKETAIIAPLALIVWELAHPLVVRRFRAPEPLFPFPAGRRRRCLLLLASLTPLAVWFAYHYFRTGFVFGNPEFYRYNVQATVKPLRIVIAVLMRLWQLLGYMNMFVLTLTAAMAMMYSPLRDSVSQHEQERPRIALSEQLVFAVVILAYVLAMAVVGGAVLARYMLPVIPLVILLCVSTLRRRVRWWPAAVAMVCAAFIAALFVYPPYGFAPEDNLAYSDYVRVHKSAAEFIQSRYPNSRVLTAWPASDELRKPELGYVNQPVFVVRIENFSAPQLIAAARSGVDFDLALLFSTKQSGRGLLYRFAWWRRIQEKYFDYHHDLPSQAAAGLFGGTVIYARHRGGQWVAVVQVERAQAASFVSGPGNWKPAAGN